MDCFEYIIYTELWIPLTFKEIFLKRKVLFMDLFTLSNEWRVLKYSLKRKVIFWGLLTLNCERQALKFGLKRGTAVGDKFIYIELERVGFKKHAKGSVMKQKEGYLVSSIMM